MNKKVLLVGKHTIVEPLGLLSVDEIARQEKWDSRIHLVKNYDFNKLDSEIGQYKPDLIGFSVITGSHQAFLKYMDKLRKEGYKVAIGGPHATCFPKESSEHSDYVILSQGLSSFRDILNNSPQKGIVPLERVEQLPITHRRLFYQEHPEHSKNPVKNIITAQGCPFACSHCYNSSSFNAISDALTKEQAELMLKALGQKRLFPKVQRSVGDVLAEAEDIINNSKETKMIFFQDDVFGVDMDWLRQFKEEYPKRINLPFHAQVRFESVDPHNINGKERAYLIRESGCSGLTIAIESSNDIVRRELLNRPMQQDLIFRVMHEMKELGYKIRTEQMLGLPLGATSVETPINLQADLETLALNTDLRKETGLPNLAWASIYVPYRGTALGDYCFKHGFYKGDYEDIPDTFFESSVLRFPKRWVGKGLSREGDYWLDEESQHKYVSDLKNLRDIFQLATALPEGVEFAKQFLKGERTINGLSTALRRHIYDYELFKVN